MRNLIITLILIFGFSVISKSQTYSATIIIENIDISSLGNDEKIIVPVKLANKSGGDIMGFQLYIEYNHEFIQWNGSSEEPLSGVKNIHPSFTDLSTNWVYNDNGNFVAIVWHDPSSKGIKINEEETLFELVFNLKSEISNIDELELSWGTTLVEENGRIVKGETKMVSELLDYYELTLINGLLKK